MTLTTHEIEVLHISKNKLHEVFNTLLKTHVEKLDKY